MCESRRPNTTPVRAVGTVTDRNKLESGNKQNEIHDGSRDQVDSHLALGGFYSTVGFSGRHRESFTE